MIIYSEEESITKPFGIKKLDGTRDINFKLPHIAVGVFSEYLLDDIVAKFGCEKVGVISCANCQRPVYVMKYKDIKITLFLAGVSYHYLPESESIELNKEYRELFKKVLQENSYDYVEGATWTTDGFYRETREKMEMFKKKGAICVEMEGASIAAICEYKKLNYFTFYYAGDNLDAVEWKERSISQLINFEKKTKVPFLAFELAYKIENKT